MNKPMNAQEALDELKRAKETLYPLVTMYDSTGLSDETAMILNNIEPIFQQLIDQSNAKPKTLEELGWKKSAESFVGKDQFSIFYNRPLRLDSVETPSQSIEISKDVVFVAQFTEELDFTKIGLSQDDLLAIAEKMKELGMTNE